jgi:hypothetical protein
MSNAEIAVADDLPNSPVALRKLKGRSRVTTGRSVLAGLRNGRTEIARRYADLVAMACTDLGGASVMSQAKIQLARRFAALSVQLEALETRIANGEVIDTAQYSQLTSTLVRVVSRLGVERLAKDIGPTLGDLLRADHEEQRRARQGVQP